MKGRPPYPCELELPAQGARDVDAIHSRTRELHNSIVRIHDLAAELIGKFGEGVSVTGRRPVGSDRSGTKTRGDLLPVVKVSSAIEQVERHPGGRTGPGIADELRTRAWIDAITLDASGRHRFG
jgi:hypothetical protein